MSRVAEVDQLAIVARQRLEPVVGRLDENLRLVAGRAQHPLNPEHFVADGVAVTERREDLVDPDHAAFPPRLQSAASPRTSCGRPADPDAGGRTSRAAARWRRRGASFVQALEHVEVLALDDRPVVVVAERTAARCGRACRSASGSRSIASSVLDELGIASRSRGRRCCGCTGP